MNAPFRDETPGLEARAQEARRELAELRAAMERAGARHRAALAALERRMASQAPALESSIGGATISARSFWVGVVMGGLIGLLMWLPIIGGR